MNKYKTTKQAIWILPETSARLEKVVDEMGDMRKVTGDSIINYLLDRIERLEYPSLSPSAIASEEQTSPDITCQK